MPRSKAGYSYPDLTSCVNQARSIFEEELAGASLSRAAYWFVSSLGRVLSYVCGAIMFLILASQAAVLDSWFLQWSFSAILDLWGRILGLPRTGSSRATGYAQFAATSACTIPAGRLITSDAGISYTTDAETVVSAAGAVSVAITARDAGSAANLISGSALYLSEAIVGITSEGTAQTDITGGADVEDDESYRARLLYRLSHPPCGGAEGDYVSWALDCPTVERAWCLPTSPLPGIITVLYTLDPDAIADTADAPVPDDAADAASVPVAYVNHPSGYSFVFINKSDINDATQLNSPAPLSFVGGKLIFPKTAVADPKELVIDHCVINTYTNGDPDQYAFRISTPMTTDPQIGETCAVLCAYSRDVYDGIRYDATDPTKVQIPGDADLIVKLPFRDEITITITGLTGATAASVAAEIDDLLLDYGPGNQVIPIWEVHAAIAAAPGHTGHTLVAPAADVAVADYSIPLRGTTTINGSVVS